MHYLILSIVCSVAVSILLKISKSKGISINQAVAINYPVAAISAFVLFKPDFSSKFNILLSEWQILLSLGILLPAVFIIMYHRYDSQSESSTFKSSTFILIFYTDISILVS